MSKMSGEMVRTLDPTGYETDKSKVLLEQYELFFRPLADNELTLLEIGIAEGGSLMLWRDYFVNGIIVGIDIKPVSLDDPTGRIKTFTGWQHDTALLEKVAREAAPNGFDIIIDDGSHVAWQARRSFWYLFDYWLKPGGLYAFEDWGCGYWESLQDGKRYMTYFGHSVNHTTGMVGFVKELVDECGMESITHEEKGLPPQRESKFEYLHVARRLVIAVKKSNLPMVVPESRRTDPTALPGIPHSQ
jgi:hypothetical protein